MSHTAQQRKSPLLTISALQRPPTATRRAQTDLISRSADERHHRETHVERYDNDDDDAISLDPCFVFFFFCVSNARWRNDGDISKKEILNCEKIKKKGTKSSEAEQLQIVGGRRSQSNVRVPSSTSLNKGRNSTFNYKRCGRSMDVAHRFGWTPSSESHHVTTFWLLGCVVYNRHHCWSIILSDASWICSRHLGDWHTMWPT